MAAARQTNGRRSVRLWTRRLGVSILSLVFVLLLIVAYLNWLGFPAFVLRELQAKLQERGLSIDVQSVRLRGFSQLEFKGLKLAFEASGRKSEIQLEHAVAELANAWGHPWRGLAAVTWKGATIWLRSRNSEAPALDASQLRGHAEFLKDGSVHIEQAHGEMRGAQVQLAGRIVNAAQFRGRQIPRKGGAAQQAIDRVIETFAELEFEKSSVVHLHVDGDALDPSAWAGRLRFDASKLQSPGWTGTNILAAAVLGPAGNGQLSGNLQIDVGRLWAGTGEISEAQVAAELVVDPADLSHGHCSWEIRAAALSEWFGDAAEFAIKGRSEVVPGDQIVSVANADLGGFAARAGESGLASLRLEMAQSLKTGMPISATGRLLVNAVASDTASIGRLEVLANLSENGSTTDEVPPDWGPWRVLAPYDIQWHVNLTNLVTEKLTLNSLDGGGAWDASRLTISNCKAALYGGELTGTLDLDVPSRRLDATAAFNFDGHGIAGLLTPASQRWLRQFAWDRPPVVQGRAACILPAWTDPKPRWRQQVLPTVTLDGHFESAGGSFRGIPVSAASSHFSMTNLFWHLPDLHLTRPEGQARIDYKWDMATAQYHWSVQSQTDITALAPLLDPKAAEVLTQLSFSEPPRLNLDIRGRWHAPEETSVQGELRARTFQFRDESFDEFYGQIVVSNLVLQLTDGFLRKQEQEIVAPFAAFDFKERLIFVTNAISTFDGLLAGRLIHPKVYKALEQYRFSRPPTVRINGAIPAGDISKADVHFDVAGGPFSFWHFRAPQVQGKLHWKGKHLSIADAEADFYNGNLFLSGEFDFAPRVGTDFQFRARVIGADLSSLIADISERTNRVGGILDGELVITSANSKDPNSWKGYGRSSVRDGDLWDIPVFGAFSMLLNKVTPGLGSSQVSSGSATFTVKESTVHTDDLELRAPALRLHYSGSVDLVGNVDAQVQAQVLRDAWVVGPVVSLVFWPLTKAFVYRITGTVTEPVSEPLYVPQMFLFPFRPIGTVRGILEPEKQDKKTGPPGSFLK